jgi:hypothetical protein
MALKDFLTFTIVVLVIAAFVALWGFILFRVWKSKIPPPPVFNEAVQYSAPILTSLVSAVVAVAFGIVLAKSFHSLASITEMLFSLTPPNWISGVYIITYLIVGTACWVTWVVRGDITPPLVKNCSMGMIGFIVAIVSAFFGVKP